MLALMGASGGYAPAVRVITDVRPPWPPLLSNHPVPQFPYFPSSRMSKDGMMCTKLGDLSVICTCHYATTGLLPPSAAQGWCYGLIRSQDPQG